MKDEELNLEEIESPHTLGGSGRSYVSTVTVVHTYIRQSHGLRQTIPVSITITDAPVYMRERGEGGRGECGHRSTISAVVQERTTKAKCGHKPHIFS